MQDIHRDLGRLEGTVAAQGERLDSIQGKIDANSTAVNTKLDEIEEAIAAKNREVHSKLDDILRFQEQQKGALRITMFFGGALGAIAGLVIGWFKP